MALKRIAHAALRVSDMDRALKFYCDGLGMKRKFSLRDRQGRPWIEYLEIVPCEFLELFYDNCSQSPQRKNPNRLGILHLAIEVDNMEQHRQELINNGIQPDGEIKMQGDHTYQLWVTDPDGNRIEFMQYTDESLQLREN